VGFWSFVIVRGLMNLVAGLVWGALGGLTRDMSPRVSRGAAFGLLTVGAVSCQWLWNQVPAWTLPIFHSWQSQILIMGILAIVLFVPVLLCLKDLSPQLRLMVMDSESAGEAFEAGDLPQQPPDRAMDVFKQLLSKWEIWMLVVGVVAFLTTAITIQTFGPLMFTEAYHYKPAEAAAMTAKFWLLNLVMLVPAGWFSDYLRVRKPITIALGLVAFVLLTWWELNFNSALSPNALGWLTLLLGGILAAAFIPWCALYSEYVEDLSPSLQATGWSFFSAYLPHLDRFLRSAAVVGSGALWMGDLDVGDGYRHGAVFDLDAVLAGLLETGRLCAGRRRSRNSGARCRRTLTRRQCLRERPGAEVVFR